MNRTQYESIHGTQVKEPCKFCRASRDSQTRIRVMRRKEHKALRLAKSAAIESGKVIQLFERDEVTGWHYNVRTETLGGRGSL